MATIVVLLSSLATPDNLSAPRPMLDIRVYENDGPAWLPAAASPSLMPCNLVYIKVTKCASSTSGGVTRRIGAYNNLSGVPNATWIKSEPGLWANHGAWNTTTGRIHWQSMLHFRLRTFLWTVVRQPASRCLSHHYFNFRETKTTLKRQQLADSTHEKLVKLQQCKDHAFNYIRPPDEAARSFGLRAWTPAALVDRVYSFVGLVERYDESMVLLASLLGIPLSQVLYLPSKDSRTSHQYGHAMVPHASLSDEPGEVRQAATSAAFNESNAADLELHRLAGERRRHVTSSHDLELHRLAGACRHHVTSSRDLELH